MESKKVPCTVAVPRGGVGLYAPSTFHQDQFSNSSKFDDIMLVGGGGEGTLSRF